MNSPISEDFFVDGARVAWKRGALEKFEVARENGEIQTKEGPQKYQAGFYIFTGPHGEKYSMPKDVFDSLKIDNGDGTAMPKKIPKLVKLADHNGSVNTSWGEVLFYRKNKDFIVRHGSGDYGVVDIDIFHETYEFEEEDANQAESV